MPGAPAGPVRLATPKAHAVGFTRLDIALTGLAQCVVDKGYLLVVGELSPGGWRGRSLRSWGRGAGGGRGDEPHPPREGRTTQQEPEDIIHTTLSFRESTLSPPLLPL